MPSSTDLVTAECRALLAAAPAPMRYTAADFSDVALAAADSYVRSGAAAVDLTPGDSTRYPLVLTDLHRLGMTGVGGELAVAVMNDLGGAVALGMPCYLQPYDMAEYLGVRNAHTATVLAVFLNLFSAHVDDLRASHEHVPAALPTTIPIGADAATGKTAASFDGAALADLVGTPDPNLTIAPSAVTVPADGRA